MNAPPSLSSAAGTKPSVVPKLPIDFGKLEFLEQMDDVYDWLLEHEPVTKGKASIMKGYFVTRYDDCLTVLKDKERFTRVRNKSKGKGGGVQLPH